MSMMQAAMQKELDELKKKLAQATSSGNQAGIDNIMSDGPANFTVSGGSNNEQKGRIEGLQRAKTLTGQNPYEIGQDYQQAYGNIKKRTELSDTGSELLRANKAGAVADARNQMQAQGVKGGAALGAVSQVERAKSYDVNNQLIQNQRQAEMDYMNATKSNANFTQASEMNFGQMAVGKDVKAPPSNSGGFTVICTELYRQGYYSKEIYELDQEYGRKLISERPEVYIGYRSWADKLVPLMRKSNRWTKAVAFFAIPWAMNMAGKKNLFGKVLSVVGELGCGIIGTIILMGEKYAVCEKK
jgi:hypothetical protein